MVLPGGVAVLGTLGCMGILVGFVLVAYFCPESVALWPLCFPTHARHASFQSELSPSQMRSSLDDDV